MTWGGREKREETKAIAKPGVAVQAYNSIYSGCGGRISGVGDHLQGTIKETKFQTQHTNKRAGTGSSGIDTSWHA
jgi:hypothetical protein